MHKFSRQIVQEEKLRLEPHLISTVVRLLLDCGCYCGTDRNNRSGKREENSGRLRPDNLTSGSKRTKQ